MEYMGVPVATQKVTSSDTAASLPTNVLKCQAVLITVENASIRFCVGGSTPTTSLGHVVANGDSLRLTNPAQVSSFKYISAVGGSAASLMITGEFV